MRKIFRAAFLIVFIFACAPIANAKENLNKVPFFPSVKQDQSQSKMHTLSDVKAFVRDLEDARRNGLTESLHVLGVFFLKDHKLDNGVFKADVEKGIQYLTESAQLGYGVSSSYLAIYFLSNNEIDSALSQLRWTIVKADKTTTKIKYSATLQFASIVLDYFPEDIKKLQEAKDYLLISNNKKKSATLSLLLANVYHRLGREKKASRFLTQACTSKTDNKKVLSFCKNSRLVEKVEQ